MIEGMVNAAYEPIVRLAVQGPSGQSREIEVVVDTGFNGYMTLPPGLVADLGLPLAGTGSGVLADGSVVRFDVHYVAVLWDGHQRYIRVDVAGATPLLGMALLHCRNLNIDVEDRGRVAIERKG